MKVNKKEKKKYIYIYIYIERERERERENMIGREKRLLQFLPHIIKVTLFVKLCENDVT